MKRSLLKRFINYALLLLIIVSLPIVNSDYKKVEKEKVNSSLPLRLEDVQKLYPKTESYIQNKDKSYTANDATGNELGQFIVSNDFIETNFGYAGEINTLVGFKEDLVDGVVLLDNVDSRSYVRKVLNSGLLEKWQAQEMNALPTMEVDAVGGATRTSSAIIRAVKESSASYLSIVASSKISVREIIKTSLFVVIILLSLLMSFKKGMSRYRMIYLVALIVVSGFVLQAMLSVALFDGWIKQGISISNSWMSVTLLLFALVMPMVGKNKYYCTYLCPMGALQELTGKVSPFKKYSLRLLKFRYFNANDLYLLFIVVAMFCSLNIDFTSFEPFSAFAVTIASWGMLIFGALVILFSLFFNRPWCAICPTGCTLDKLSLPNKK